MLPLVKAYYAARASVTPIQFGESNNGNVQIAVEFQVEDHPEFAGETITWLGHFTDATAERTLESLQIAGWQGEDVSELAGVPGTDVLGEVVSLACDVEEYEGKQRLRVQWVNRPRCHFQFKQEADAGAIKQLGARLRATAKSLRAQGGAPRKAAGSGSQRPAAQNTQRSSGGGGYSAPAGRHPNEPGADDDIPFASADIGHEPSPIADIMLRTV